MSESTTDTTPNRMDSLDRESIVEYLRWGLLGLFLLLAVIALFGFYTNATNAISLWTTTRYEPLFQAGFNLVILIAAALGASVVLRSLSERSDIP